jgi:hypothetical protein
MTLPASFPLSMSQVATELGISLPLSIEDSRVLALAGVTAPPVSFSNLLGKAASFTGNVSITQVQEFLIAGNPNAPFFSGTLDEIGMTTNSGDQIRVASSPVSFWTGSITLTNNTTGASMTLPYLGSGIWGATDTTGGQLVRVNHTDSFTVNY